MTDKPKLDEWIDDLLTEGAIKLDGFNDCIIGIGTSVQHSGSHVPIYSVDRIISSMMDEWGLSLEDAEEYFSYNIFGLNFGDGTPIFQYSKIENEDIVAEEPLPPKERDELL